MADPKPPPWFAADPMIARRLLITLVFALPMLLVALAVLLGAFALVQALGDELGARVLWWVAMSCLLLTIINVVLLVLVLGLRELQPRNRRRRPRRRTEERPGGLE